MNDNIAFYEAAQRLLGYPTEYMTEDAICTFVAVLYFVDAYDTKHYLGQEQDLALVKARAVEVFNSRPENDTQIQ